MFKFSWGKYQIPIFNTGNPVFSTGISLVAPNSTLYQIAAWLKISISLLFTVAYLRKHLPAKQSKYLK